MLSICSAGWTGSAGLSFLRGTDPVMATATTTGTHGMAFFCRTPARRFLLGGRSNFAFGSSGRRSQACRTVQADLAGWRGQSGDGAQQLCRCNRLGEHGVDARGGSACAHRGFVGVAGQEQRRRVTVRPLAGANLRDQRTAVERRHLVIGDQQIEASRPRRGKRTFAILGGDAAMAGRGQQPHQDGAQIGRVVGDQHGEATPRRQRLGLVRRRFPRCGSAMASTPRG